MQAYVACMHLDPTKANPCIPVFADAPAFFEWALALIPYEEAARLRGCCTDTIRREVERGALAAVDISPRRKAIRRHVALGLTLPVGGCDAAS